PSPDPTLFRSHLDPIVYDLGGPQIFLRHIAVQILRQVHHPIIVSISLIQFHEGKLRIMSRVKSLVSEHTADLVNSLQSSYDQSLEIKLKGDTELEILVQCVEVRLKRSCRSSSGVAHEDRRLHFHKALSVQISPDRAENLRTLDKGIFYLRVHDQVHISLAIADIRVRQAVELLRKDL